MEAIKAEVFAVGEGMVCIYFFQGGGICSQFRAFLPVPFRNIGCFGLFCLFLFCFRSGSFLRGRRGRSLCRRAFFRQGCGCYPGRVCYGRNALVGNAFKRRRLCTGCKLAEKKEGSHNCRFFYFHLIHPFGHAVLKRQLIWQPRCLIITAVKG